MEFSTDRTIVLDTNIAQPSAVIPASGDTEVLLYPELIGSKFYTSYDNGLLVREFQITTKDDINFENPVWTGFSDAYNITVDEILPVETELIWRCRDYISPVSELTIEGYEQEIIHLGSIPANTISTLSVKAESNIPNSKLFYRIVDGKLPNGLTLSLDGEIIGKARQYPSAEGDGLTYIDSGSTTFDGSTTTIDRCFVFVVEAKDRYEYSAIATAFSIYVNDPEDLLYSNIYMQPLESKEKRDAYRRIVSNPDLFPPEHIYRPNDKNFGLQTQMRMLVYAGIETKNIAEYVAATAAYHKRKTFYLGDVKYAVAKEYGSNNVIYEVVYIEVIDPAEPATGITQSDIIVGSGQSITADQQEHGNVTTDEPLDFRPDNNTIKADNTNVQVSGTTDIRKKIVNMTSMRNQISTIGAANKEFLPLWMRTAQAKGNKQLDFVMAVPLCYCKPGYGQTVVNNLVNSQYDFKEMHFDVDRYIIDSTTGNSNEQYILFANYSYNV